MCPPAGLKHGDKRREGFADVWCDSPTLVLSSSVPRCSCRRSSEGIIGALALDAPAQRAQGSQVQQRSLEQLRQDLQELRGCVHAAMAKHAC
mmetsp:Transcript_81465/g.220719  ORF Transcript_81465/g.220719 Transcript_81465/m.220719 type:complete len:92 (+) Transcript_81465:60-335(+)